MADLTITAANVLPQTGAQILFGTAAEAITAGKTVYFNDDAKWALADSDSATAAARNGSAVAVNSAAAGQPVAVQKGGDLALGAVLTAGDPYYVSSTAGGICPHEDLSAGENVVQIGIAKSATVLAISVQNSGVTK